MKKNLTITMVSDVPPDPSYTAGQVLDKIIENTAFAHFQLYWINQSNLPEPCKLSARIEWVKKLSVEPGILITKIENRFIRLFALFPKLQTKMKMFFRFIASLILGLRLSLQLRRDSADILWLVLQGEKLALTYYLISQISGKKIILHQWDPIEWWMEHKGHKPWFMKLVRMIIHQVEKKAIVNLVPSEAWQNLQKSRGLVSLRIDNFFLSHELGKLTAQRVGVETDVNAVFLGQLYSNYELQKLIEILSSASQNLNRRLVLHYFGSGNIQITEPGVELVHHGFLPRTELIAKISKWDLALLPYPLEKRFDPASRYSFPSKSRVYLAAGLPILSYCQLNSSPELFFNQNYQSHYCNAFKSADIQKFLNTCLDRSTQATKQRIIDTEKLITDHFVAEVELAPFHNILLSSTGFSLK